MGSIPTRPTIAARLPSGAGLGERAGADAVDQGRHEPGTLDHSVGIAPLVGLVSAAAHAAQTVEDRHAQRGDEAGVAPAADWHAGERRVVELDRATSGEREQR